jgi:hypothetical protein
MKAEMKVEIRQGYVAMAAFIVHTTWKMLAFLNESKGKGSKTEEIRDQSGAVVGSWSLTKG